MIFANNEVGDCKEPEKLSVSDSQSLDWRRRKSTCSNYFDRSGVLASCCFDRDLGGFPVHSEEAVVVYRGAGADPICIDEDNNEVSCD